MCGAGTGRCVQQLLFSLACVTMPGMPQPSGLPLLRVEGTDMDDLMTGSELSSLFRLKSCARKRVSSYARDGSNRDWIDVEPGAVARIADIAGCGVVRHIWCTMASKEAAYPRRIVLRMYWDEESEPSVEAPIGDFFGIGHGITRNFTSAPLSMGPEDGRAFNCFFPMPFGRRCRIEVQNECERSIMFYFYVDYEEYGHGFISENVGYFHAQWHREADTNGWADRDRRVLEEKAGKGFPEWYPNVWTSRNVDGADNYVILEAEGRGKYVGCNLNVDCFEHQANDWYGEGDDMIFVDGEAWPPSLHGTGTEDYFNTAFCPTQEFCTPFYGVTVYSGEKGEWKWSGKNSMYRFHIPDPVYFQKSIRVTIEHGHNNMLSNDYSSTAYWYQSEPHRPFPRLLPVPARLPRKDNGPG